MICINTQSKTASAEVPDGPLKKRLIKLNEDKYVFHWAPKSKVLDFLGMDKDAPLTPETILQFSKKEASDQIENNRGAGMYFALNPVISRSYGYVKESNSWIMIALRIPHDAIFLNLSYPDQKYKISKKEMHWIRQQGCPEPEFGQLNSSTCALNAYLKAAGASGYFYSWIGYSFSFCEPDSRLSDAALILRDADLIHSDQLSVFDLHSEDAPENTSVLSIFNALFKSYMGIDQTAGPWHTEKLNPVASNTLLDFAQHSLIGVCQ